MLATLQLAASTSCADPAALDRQLDEVLLALRPGLSLEEVASVTRNFREWLVPAHGELLVSPWAKGGHRVASLQLVCGYADGKLGDCRASVPRDHTQFIESRQYEKLRLGEPLGGVLSALCQPERTEVASDGTVTLSYSMDYPFEAYIPYGPARSDSTARADCGRRWRPDARVAHYRRGLLRSAC